MTAASPVPARNLRWAALTALFRRDIVVTGRELWAFLAQVLLQPLATLFIFGRVLPGIGMASPQYARILMPGILVLTIVLTALQSTAMPLVIDFGWTKEIEDRLLAPLPVAWVALEKVLFAAARGMVAGAMMIGLGIVVVGAHSVSLTAANLGAVAAYAVLAALVGGSVGLTLGTLVQPQQLNMMFALILTPMLFTGCTQYPWASLNHLRWFQLLTLLNPITYASEGMRAVMMPGLNHLNAVYVLPALGAAIAGFGWIGMRGFARRAVG